jgi:hypothetical protein
VSRGTQVPVQRGSEGFVYGAFTLCGHPFQDARLPCCLVTLRPHGQTGPTTPPCKHDGLGYIRVRSPLLAESLLISIPVGTEMVHFPTLPSRTYVFSPGYPGMTPGGFPHSEISGSKLVCSSPKLIAAYHVLHRLLVPRHSPHALSSLTIKTLDSTARPAKVVQQKSRLSHTAVWSVKTTVCRIFSCQRVPIPASLPRTVMAPRAARCRPANVVPCP